MATMLLGNLNSIFQKVNADVVLNYTKGATTSSPLGNWLKTHIPLHIVLERRLLDHDSPQGLFAWENDGAITHMCAYIPDPTQVAPTEWVNLNIKKQLMQIAHEMRLSGKTSIILSYLGGQITNLTYSAFMAIVDDAFPTAEGFKAYIFSSSKYTPYHIGEIDDHGAFTAKSHKAPIAPQYNCGETAPAKPKHWIETLSTTITPSARMEVKRRPAMSGYAYP